MNYQLYKLSVLFSLSGFAFAAPAFELRDGDRVAWVGDTFIEREQYQGWIELAATTQFPQSAVTFRNLGWSADTPAGKSRGGLSLLQAGLEPPDEGWSQLQNQLSVYKPNVVILGYGMASSLPGGQTLEEFRSDFERLLDTTPKAAGGDVRFLIVGPPPRFALPVGETGEIEKHRESLAKIDAALKEIAEKRGLPFVSLQNLPQDKSFTENGIHLTETGYKAVARHLEKSLGWKPVAWDQGDSAAALRRHILKKNDWFFHRSRPANMAYIFGFRKKEQGNNAGEILEFDKLVALQDAEIAKMRDLSKNIVVPDEPVRTESAFAAKVTQPYPNFTVADGYEITLWAENPLLHKPTQMNFDPSGRLWVASSETYPQVEVGQTPDDKIIVLHDSDGDGKADKSTVFAEGMLMPTAVLPGDGGVYVGQSTDLLHFKDTDGDGKSDQKTRVLSGFGTEDTHHNLHTLRRGPDGRLWMNQSIYTRSDSETPGGVFRLKSGGIMRFDPRTSDLESVFFGWCNPWGHQFDKYGQSFVTDGAGGAGINWAVPGAMYFTFAKAGKILGSVSPGSYPKFSGLEIVESAHFPKDWQGSMITCDFRAHRVVRFSIADQAAGYAAQEVGDLVRTDDVNFRPIDVKIGPDGALYIADWSNPIINHGEVDFRDPRRDREHGRIWRVTKKGGALSQTKDFTKLSDKDLLDSLASENRYEREQATAVLFEKKSETLTGSIQQWKDAAKDDSTLLAALWLSQGRNDQDFGLLKKVLSSKEGPVRAAGIRVFGDWLTGLETKEALGILTTAINDEHPRVRIEAIRVLSKIPGWEAMDRALAALNHPTDRFIDYALWLNVQEHGEEWLNALMEKKVETTGREKPLEFTLANLPAAKAATVISQLLPKPLPKDGGGPWLNLALKTGDASVIGSVFEQLTNNGFDEITSINVLKGIDTAINQRQIKLGGDLSKLRALMDSPKPAVQTAAIALAGAAGNETHLPRLIEIAADGTASEPVRGTAIDALSNFPQPVAKEALVALADEKSPPVLRQHSVIALARHHRETAVPLIAKVASEISDPEASRHFWQRVLSAKGISSQLAEVFVAKPLSAEVAGVTLQQVPDVAEHDALLKVLRQQGASQVKSYGPEQIKKISEQAEAKGDAARGEIVYRRMALACTACHAIGGAGGKVGPDMTSIGASAPMDYLVESVVLPGAKVKEGYHSVILETKDGKAIMGQLVKSGGGSSIIRDATGTEITVPDEMLAKKTDAGSLMPGNLINGLPEQDVNDLFKFLSQLGKPGEFDATKSKAPRVWGVVGLTPAIQEAASKADASLPWIPVNATVNGRLLPEDVKLAVGTTGEIMAGAKLQLAEATKISLQFGTVKPVAIWINGASATSGNAELQPGIHKIVVRFEGSDQPIEMKCEAGTFLPEW